MYGGVALLALFVIITAIVFIAKFVLDCALNKKLASLEKPAKNDNQKERPVPKDEDGYIYAVKTEKKRKGNPKAEYTVIPQGKLFRMENPGKYEDAP